MSVNGKRIGLAVLGVFVLAFLVGCGPTRKEYAINEALLVDQTRSLEDQLYRAHFQIQRLEDENKNLRKRLADKGETLDEEKTDAAPNVPFAPGGSQNNAPSDIAPNTGAYPMGESELSFPVTRGGIGGRDAVGGNRVVRTAQVPNDRRYVSGQTGRSGNVNSSAYPNMGSRQGQTAAVPARIRRQKQNYAVRSSSSTGNTVSNRAADAAVGTVPSR